MKYMTYERLVRLQSQDEEVADAAFAEWEQACQEYNKHVEAIRPKLPESVQGLLDGPCLHDAKLVNMGTDEDSRFFIEVQPDTPGNHGIRLRYELLAEPKAMKYPDSESRDVGMIWLYDELDVAEIDVPGIGRVSLFTHSILFSEGIELVLHFHKLDVKRYRDALPSILGHRREGAGERELQPA
jgi:hypothetical protein